MPSAIPQRAASNRIHRVNGYDQKNGYTYYPAVIAGAGESGIAMACKLKEDLGFDQFRVFERMSGIGGTWWINRYEHALLCSCALAYFTFLQVPRYCLRCSRPLLQLFFRP
jgi:hypothetical protein